MPNSKPTAFMRYLFFFLLFLTGTIGWAQQLTPAQQAELDKAGQQLKNYSDPVYMERLLNEQILEMKKNGATPAQIRELEKSRDETIRQLKADLAEAARQKNQPAGAPEKDSLDASETMMAALKKRVAQPDTTPVSLIYDEQRGHYSGLPAQFRFYSESKLAADQFPAFMLKKFGVTLRETNRYDFGGLQTIRYEQLHEGYVVGLAHFSIVLDKNGHVTRANGDLFDIKTTSPRPDARTLPTTLLPKLRTATSLPSLTLVASDADESASVPYARAEPLVWMSPGLDPANAAAVLTQPFVVEGPGSSKRWYLNTSTGVVVAVESLTRNCHVAPPGPLPATVPTFHHGKQPVFLTRRVGPKGIPVFALADSSETPAIIVVQPGTKALAPIVTKDSTFADNQLRLRGDFDVLYGFRTTARYFKKMGLNSYDNAGASVRIEPYNEQNADWSSSRKRFRYGLISRKPVATLQIVAHEFTHAVNTYANKLIYKGESGALDEAIADMFSIIIDHQTLNGNWLIGEEISPGGFRNLANPTAKGDPDTYDVAPWKPTSVTFDDGNVHSNSGVGNRWFYLLIKGGKGQNGLKKSYDVKTPIGYDRAARLLLQTLPRLGRQATYDDFCRETIATAEQLFGDCHDFTQSVKQAWYAVGVLADPPPLCRPGWTMEMVLKAGSEKTRSMLYVKGDSIVWVYKDPESISKIFTRRNSAYTTTVVQNADGLNSATLPKDYYGSYLTRMNDELLPAQEVLMAEQLQQVRAALASPATEPEERAQLKQTEAAILYGQQQMKQVKTDTKVQQQELAESSKSISEAAFWRNKGGKRKFDKDHVRQTTLYQGKYLTRQYVLSPAMTWWSTTEIPLRLSDVCQIIPMASFIPQNSAINYLMRGFPVNYLNMIQMQNISESVPNSFDALFSRAAVFQ